MTQILEDNISGGTGTGAYIGRAGRRQDRHDRQLHRRLVRRLHADTSQATVWVGYPQGEIPMQSVHGITVAGGTFPAEIWQLLHGAGDGDDAGARLGVADRRGRRGEPFTQGQYGLEPRLLGQLPTTPAGSATRADDDRRAALAAPRRPADGRGTAPLRATNRRPRRRPGRPSPARAAAASTAAVRRADPRPAGVTRTRCAPRSSRSVFLAACAVPDGGLFRAARYRDVHVYQGYAERFLHGELPYRDVFVEYPPGAFAAFLPRDGVRSLALQRGLQDADGPLRRRDDPARRARARGARGLAGGGLHVAVGLLAVSPDRARADLAQHLRRLACPADCPRALAPAAGPRPARLRGRSGSR